MTILDHRYSYLEIFRAVIIPFMAAEKLNRDDFTAFAIRLPCDSLPVTSPFRLSRLSSRNRIKKFRN